jgi:hypothetical protein
MVQTLCPRVLSVVGIWLIVVALAAQGPRVLLPITHGEKHGFIDLGGRVVVPPMWDFAWDFSEGLAAVRHENRIGFINGDGELVIKPVFADAVITRFVGVEFSEGLAAVATGEFDNPKWGYIDRSGAFVVPPTLSVANHFRQGFALVAVGELWGALGRGGRTVYPIEFSREGDIVDGRFVVRLFDRAGKMRAIIPIEEPVSPGCEDFHTEAGLRRMVETFSNTGGCSEGLVAVRNADGKWGFANLRRELLIPFQFSAVQSFRYGAAKVAELGSFFSNYGRPGIRGSGLSDFKYMPYGYIDKTGKYIWRSQE